MINLMFSATWSVVLGVLGWMVMQEPVSPYAQSIFEKTKILGFLFCSAWVLIAICVHSFQAKKMQTMFVRVGCFLMLITFGTMTYMVFKFSQ